MNLLLVEDDQDIRCVLREILLDIGMSVADTADPRVALLLLQRPDPPTVLITDINLGCCIDGFGLAAAARRVQPALSVVFITGFPGNLARHSPKPADRFVLKPFTCQQLLHAINEVAVHK